MLAARHRQSHRAGTQTIEIFEDKIGAGVADNGAAAVGVCIAYRQLTGAFVNQIARTGEAAAAGGVISCKESCCSP